MKNKLIAKKDIAAFAEGLMPDFRVFAPVGEKGQTYFKQISDGRDICLDYANTVNSPKGIFFPQAETLFSYCQQGGQMKLESPEDDSKQVVLGVRPCDAASLQLLDLVFDGDKYRDAAYLKKRENTVVVGLGCNDHQSTCFCDGLGGGPSGTAAMDVMLTDIGDAYVAEALTAKGEALVKGLADASGEAVTQSQKIKQSAEAAMTSGVAVEGVKEKLDEMFDDDYWEALHEKCLGCGICTYLCPTCHCFDIIDEATESAGERVRIWDSCQFCLFTQETSGHNPRLSSKERLRQRFMHKFNYFKDNYDRYSCVGCGRCVVSCPVNIDIRKVLNDISAG